MYRILLPLLVCVLAISANAQLNLNPAIQGRLDAFIELTNQQKYNEAFDIMYPKMFEQVRKEDLIDLMTSMNNEGLTLQVLNHKITSSSLPLVDGHETFVRMDYSANMTITIKEGTMYDSEKAAIGMKQQFESVYGAENVKWNPENKTYTILVDKAMMAVQSDGGDWYLAEINADQTDLMKSLFPEAVLKALVNVE